MLYKAKLARKKVVYMTYFYVKTLYINTRTIGIKKYSPAKGEQVEATQECTSTQVAAWESLVKMSNENWQPTEKVGKHQK